MSLLSRIIDALLPQPAPPPQGSIELKRAIDRIRPTSEQLKERIERPIPSVSDMFVGLARQEGDRGDR